MRRSLGTVLARFRGPVLRYTIEGALRYGMVHLLSGVLPLYIVNEYPKSGATWLSQMLAAALGVPFPRHRFPALRSSIMQGHYLDGWGMRNVVVVWRDGRDVMVSFYHFCLFRLPYGNAELVDEVRRDLPFADYDDVRRNLPAFIEYAFTRHQHPRFSWSQFVRCWLDAPGVVQTRYEALRDDPERELRRVVAALSGRELAPARAKAIVEQFSFEQQSGRKAGVEDRHSFFRKGLVGDWKNHFSKEARAVFDHYAGAELIALGYERDRAWVGGDAALAAHPGGTTTSHTEG